VWSFTSTTLHAFTVWYVINYEDKWTFNRRKASVFNSILILYYTNLGNYLRLCYLYSFAVAYPGILFGEGSTIQLRTERTGIWGR
jgi:putative flippase GtrA